MKRKQAATPAKKRNKANLLRLEEIRHERQPRNGGVPVKLGVKFRACSGGMRPLRDPRPHKEVPAAGFSSHRAQRSQPTPSACARTLEAADGAIRKWLSCLRRGGTFANGRLNSVE